MIATEEIRKNDGRDGFKLRKGYYSGQNYLEKQIGDGLYASIYPAELGKAFKIEYGLVGNWRKYSHSTFQRLTPSTFRTLTEALLFIKRNESKFKQMSQEEYH